MLQIIQRKPNELSKAEENQLKILLTRFYTCTNQKFIKERVSGSNTFDIVLMKSSDIVLGASYYTIDKLKTPFYRKQIPVVQFGQTFKNEYYKGGVLRRSGHWYAKKNIGYSYLLKKTLGISMIGNPRVFEHFTKMFKNHCPNICGESLGKKVSVTDFLQNVYEKKGVQLHFNADYCFAKMDFEPIDITNDWERYYKSKSESINSFFIDNEIIKLQGGRIYDNNLALITCGYRDPWSLGKRINIQI